MKKHIKHFLPILILLLCVGTAYLFVATKPVAIRATPQKATPQVRVIEAKIGSVPLIIDTLGSVIPSQSISLKSKIAGTVATLASDFKPGAKVKKDEALLTLDSIDYKTELKKKEAALAKAKADYDLEMGQQSIAKTELEQLKKIMPQAIQNGEAQSSLTLRKPQLAQAKANIDIAQADVETAKQNLERTVIKAPFDALITERTVSVGQHISTNDALATLIDINEYWIDASLAIDTLYHNNILTMDTKELPVKVTTTQNIDWQGELLQIGGSLSTASRMGKILIKVTDPLALKSETPKPPLLMGDQVRIQIEAGKYDNVIAVPRIALKNSEFIWTVIDSKLKKQEVEVIWKDANFVYIKNTELPENTYIVISDLTAPIDDMEVKTVLVKN